MGVSLTTKINGLYTIFFKCFHWAHFCAPFDLLLERPGVRMEVAFRWHERIGIRIVVSSLRICAPVSGVQKSRAYHRQRYGHENAGQYLPLGRQVHCSCSAHAHYPWSEEMYGSRGGAITAIRPNFSSMLLSSATASLTRQYQSTMKRKTRNRTTAIANAISAPNPLVPIIEDVLYVVTHVFSMLRYIGTRRAVLLSPGRGHRSDRLARVSAIDPKPPYGNVRSWEA